MSRTLIAVASLAAVAIPLPSASQDITLPDPIPLGTTVGQQAGRLLIRGATIVSDDIQARALTIADRLAEERA